MNHDIYTQGPSPNTKIKCCEGWQRLSSVSLCESCHLQKFHDFFSQIVTKSTNHFFFKKMMLVTMWPGLYNTRGVAPQEQRNVCVLGLCFVVVFIYHCEDCLQWQEGSNTEFLVDLCDYVYVVCVLYDCFSVYSYRTQFQSLCCLVLT